MNCLNLFYEENIIKRSITNNGDDECPICEENKVTVMLDCYVFKIYNL
jgi:hypothetical protein